MTTVARCPLSFLSPALRDTIVNSAAIAGGMVTTAGLSILVAKNTIGCIDPKIGIAIVALPFVCSRVIQYFVPRTNNAAINLGFVVGIAIPCAVSHPAAYAVGTVVSGVAAAFFAAMEIGFPDTQYD